MILDTRLPYKIIQISGKPWAGKAIQKVLGCISMSLGGRGEKEKVLHYLAVPQTNERLAADFFFHGSRHPV